jgi:hypothetical protein
VKFLTFILNLPWTIILIVASVFSVPNKVKLHHKPFAIIIYVRSFWYYRWIPSQKGVRAMTLGSVILLGPKLLQNDLEHELVHIEQHEREPLIHPIMNGIETLRHGYRQNKYETGAYSTSDSIHIGQPLD